jgi:NADH-quinone oxidoreductase subunit A
MTEYIPVAIIFALTGIVVAAMVSLNRLLGPHRARPEEWTTDEAFECGNSATGTAWARFSVRFYMIAILFIVFDLEVVFLYPWAIVFRELGLFGFIEMMGFISVLTVGLVFAWRKGS